MLTIVDVEQGSEAWFRARMGRPTASRFATVLAKGKGGGESVTRRKYLYQLAGEIISGEPAESFSNAHTERGKLMEPEARAAYAFLRDAAPVQVGFIHNEIAGASPDSLLGDKGILELKTKLPDLLVECIMSGEFPAEHKAQCQGCLWIAEREFVDIAVYFPRMPLFVSRAYRDEFFIGTLVKEIKAFNQELVDIVAKLRKYEEAA